MMAWLLDHFVGIVGVIAEDRVEAAKLCGPEGTVRARKRP